ncbi:hypothetical protein TRFO_12235 [Tritrichomonas foetus]|uniref:HEAT repeat family protein n=1 Tax=Tritrichomonas foetus TaxID=1144522 RepID=A0A1J4J290_9EUKA|nr:hypothetical protein TRFO_12235 [Tritrichomonas foetus]|eukprot:OHS92865.1 hypothetical protein TRFO_12235 [Tritrichomonas foetus]
MNNEDEINTAYQLILNLNSTNNKLRDESIDEIPRLSAQLGPERTIEELIPFIINSPVYTEESLNKSIKQFSKFDFSEYTEDYLNALFEAVRPLSEIEIISTRKELVKFLVHACSSVDSEISEKVLPFWINDFFKNEWPVVNSTGVNLMIETLNCFSKEARENLISDFIDFANSEIPPIVKKVVASACVKVIKYSDNPEIVEMVKTFSKCSSPTIAYELPEFLVEYFSKPNYDKDSAIEIFNNLLCSKNWRIRCKLFMTLKTINDTKQLPSDLLINAFEAGAGDKDDEVRIAVAQQTPLLSSLKNHSDNLNNNSGNIDDINNESKVSEILNNLMTDKSPHVRSAMMDTLSNSSDTESVKNYLTKLLDDKVREVRAAALEALRLMDLPESDVISLLLGFLNPENESEQREWRERRDVVTIFIEKKLKSTELFKELINDDASIVRNSIIRNMTLLTQFNENDLLPIISDASENEDYQIRQAAALILISGNFFNQEGIQILDKLAKDKISNVRLTIAKFVPRNLLIHTQFENDEDEDVKFSAEGEICSISSLVY